MCFVYLQLQTYFYSTLYIKSSAQRRTKEWVNLSLLGHLLIRDILREREARAEDMGRAGGASGNACPSLRMIAKNSEIDEINFSSLSWASLSATLSQQKWVSAMTGLIMEQRG